MRNVHDLILGVICVTSFSMFSVPSISGDVDRLNISLTIKGTSCNDFIATWESWLVSTVPKHCDHSIGNISVDEGLSLIHI